MAQDRIRRKWPCPDGFREITSGEVLPANAEIYDRLLLCEGRNHDKCMVGHYLGWTDGGWIKYRHKSSVNGSTSTPHYWMLVKA